MGRRRIALMILLGVAVAWLAPSAAGAQPRIPPDAALVAGPTPSGSRLLAFDHKRKLCVVFLRRGEPRRFAYPRCERPAPGLRDLNLSVGGAPRLTMHWGVVAPEIGAAELVFRGGRSVRAEASAGAYAGRYAGRVRFLLAEHRGRRGRLVDPMYIRLFDDSGVLLGLADTYRAERRVGRVRTLARATTGRASWSLRAFRTRMLIGLPGNEERFVDLSCVAVRSPVRSPYIGAGVQRQHARTCANPEARPQWDYGLEQECTRLGTVATAIVPSGTRSAAAVLGDGRVWRLALHRLPAGQGRRAFALVLGSRLALRRVVVIGADGRRDAFPGLAPAAIRCGEGGSTLFTYGLEPPVPRGRAALTVYDDGVQLCATLGRPTGHPDECRYPPLDAQDARILTREAGGRKLVAGVVPGDVVGGLARLDDGRRAPIEVSDGSYSGRYAGLVRFFVLELAAGDAIESVRLVDARGRRTTVPFFQERTPLGPRRTLMGGPAGLRLWGQSYGPADPFSAWLCVGLGSREEDCSVGFGGDIRVTAECKPRRLVFWGLLPRMFRKLAVETNLGVIDARVEPLPRVLRPRLLSGSPRLRRILPVSVFRAVVPADARPAALLVENRPELRRRLRFPPAAQQCGYEDWLF